MIDLDEDEAVRVLEEIALHSVRQPNGCLEWQKRLSPSGYGILWTGKRGARAHRAVWIAHNGPIEPNISICHKCDNRKCVEIKCLFSGTNSENMADMVAKGRQPLGTKNGLSKLTEADVREIYSISGQTRALAKRFGISDTTVRDIRRGELWRQVTKDLPPPLRITGRRPRKTIRASQEGNE